MKMKQELCVVCKVRARGEVPATVFVSGTLPRDGRGKLFHDHLCAKCYADLVEAGANFGIIVPLENVL